MQYCSAFFTIIVFLTLYELVGTGLIKLVRLQLVRVVVDLAVNHILWSSIIALKYSLNQSITFRITFGLVYILFGFNIKEKPLHFEIFF